MNITISFHTLIIIVFMILLISYIMYLKYFRTSLLKNLISKDTVIKTLYRQCARWSTASTQDENPLIATLHANYAAGYLWALEDLFTSEEISSFSGFDHKKLRSEIQKNQDITTKKITSACPDFSKLSNGASKIVAQVAGEL